MGGDIGGGAMGGDRGGSGEEGKGGVGGGESGGSGGEPSRRGDASLELFNAVSIDLLEPSSS
ncbi:hypothetical protein HanPSC8_Chr00c192g0806191 [Helianthus annuus]|nr:hypothetical protein HanPSC8_Chr00c192g0806191 [Helianthus annuus]